MSRKVESEEWYWQKRFPNCVFRLQFIVPAWIWLLHIFGSISKTYHLLEITGRLICWVYLQLIEFKLPKVYTPFYFELVLKTKVRSLLKGQMSTPVKRVVKMHLTTPNNSWGFSSSVFYNVFPHYYPPTRSTALPRSRLQNMCSPSYSFMPLPTGTYSFLSNILCSEQTSFVLHVMAPLIVWFASEIRVSQHKWGWNDLYVYIIRKI